MESCGKLRDIASVIYAVEICNDLTIKKEILCAPGSEYCMNENLDSVFERKQHWSEILEKKTKEKLLYVGLPEWNKEKIIGLVQLIGMKMLCWAEYHEGMFGLSRNTSVEFLRSSFFTCQGIIDSKKAAEQLINEESLSIEQKYKLACIYCFTDRIPVLFKQIPKERKKMFYSGYNPEEIYQPSLIKFWSYYIMGEIDQLKEEKKLDQYRLEKAVESGSLAAVEYCFKIPNIRKKGYILIYAALEAVKNKLKANSDWYVFQLTKCDFQSSVWTPTDYYTDIICFLFSKMNDSEKVDFLKMDIDHRIYCKDMYLREGRHSYVLEMFLDWPYLLYFREAEMLIRIFLPRRSFAILLRRICDKIENENKHLKYGEEKCVNYRKLLRKFWLKSYDCCKKYILQDNKISGDGYTSTLKEWKEILEKLFALKKFTNRDEDNILLILNYGTYDERQNIITSDEGKCMCFELMLKERWEVLDKFVLKCFFCTDALVKFKKDLISTEKAKRIFRDFIENNKLNAIHSFMEWISLPEDELNQYIEEVMFSREGRSAFMVLALLNGNNEGADNICKLLFSPEKTYEFKQTLLSEFNFYYCSDVYRGQCRRIENFLQWATSTADEIKKFKKDLIYKNLEFFENSITHCSHSLSYNCETGFHIHRIDFHGGDWENIEKILTWCLPTEKEISEFKKSLFAHSGVKIHFNLIRANQWEEAETFIAWLGLNAREEQELKKNTIFQKIEDILHDLEVTKNYETYDIVGYKFSSYGEMQDRIELILRWCLSDKESVLEFKSFLDGKFADNKDFKSILSSFGLAIEQYLVDLGTSHFSTKRKLDSFSVTKKIAISR